MSTPATPTSGRVFISYRRLETSPYARLLREELSRRLGEGQVFMDVDSIEIGIDFAEAIERAVDGCDVLLALIGPEWLTTTDVDGQRRLDDPDDTVRLEIEAALARNIRVIPVLVDGTRMPQRHQLPDSLVPLARRNALELTHNRYTYDLGRLMEAVEKVMGPGTARTARRMYTAPEQERQTRVEREAENQTTGESRGQTEPEPRVATGDVDQAPRVAEALTATQGKRSNHDRKDRVRQERVPERWQAAAKAVWWMVLIRGILAVIFGLVALFAPSIGLLTLAILFSFYAILNGVVAAVHAIRSRDTAQHWGWLVAQGVVSILAGIVALVWPSLTIVAMVLIIGIWAIAIGAAEIFEGLAGRTIGSSAWGWTFAAGMLSIILGIALIAQPAAGILALLLVLGLFALLIGVVLIVCAFRIRGAAKTMTA